MLHCYQVACPTKLPYPPYLITLVQNPDLPTGFVFDPAWQVQRHRYGV